MNVKKLLPGLAAGVAICLPTLAMAQPKDYVGLQYVQTTYEQDGLDLEPTLVVGRFGRINTDYLALEVRAGTGVRSDDGVIGGDDVELDVKHLIGGYALARYPFTEWGVVYGVVGGTQIRFAREVAGNIREKNEGGFSYGVGADLEVAYGLSLQAEYMSYHDKDDYELSALSVGVAYRF